MIDIAKIILRDVQQSVVDNVLDRYKNFLLGKGPSPSDDEINGLFLSPIDSADIRSEDRTLLVALHNKIHGKLRTGTADWDGQYEDGTFGPVAW